MDPGLRRGGQLAVCGGGNGKKEKRNKSGKEEGIHEDDDAQSENLSYEFFFGNREIMNS